MGNLTVTNVTLPFSVNNINVYSFVPAGPYSQNATLDMSIFAGWQSLFELGYYSIASGYLSLTAHLNVLTITFRANLNNRCTITQEFNSPLRMSFD